MRRPFPTFPACPVCGDPTVNSGTLGVRWEWDGEHHRVEGSFVAGACHMGYEGRLHGGLLSALVDEGMAWACAVERHSYCVTGDLAVRFRVIAPLGVPLAVLAWVAGETWGPYLRAKGAVLAPDGREVATASATFSALPRDESCRMRQALHFQPGDLDVLDEGLPDLTSPPLPSPPRTR
ncbi:MAG: PaaI family thioesterase [Acidobacteriota bacterium]